MTPEEARRRAREVVDVWERTPAYGDSSPQQWMVDEEKQGLVDAITAALEAPPSAQQIEAWIDAAALEAARPPVAPDAASNAVALLREFLESRAAFNRPWEWAEREDWILRATACVDASRRASDASATLAGQEAAGAGEVLDGTWPADDLRRAFVRGAKWWEYESRGATMWQSDQRKAEVAAEAKYPNGAVRPAGAPRRRRRTVSARALTMLRRHFEVVDMARSQDISGCKGCYHCGYQRGLHVDDVEIAFWRDVYGYLLMRSRSSDEGGGR